MSIRRLNSTGRTKIVREHAKFFVRSEGDQLYFDATLTLDQYKLPKDAQVFVEAYRQTTFMRFAFGTVASPQPINGPLRLTEFSSPEGLLFRVKVTSQGDRPGVLLAEGDRIPVSNDVEQPDNRIPLLPPAPAPLGQELWCVSTEGVSGPLLLINEALEDWKETAASPIFRALVYPAAMREVLWRVYKIEGGDDEEDLDSWRAQWLKFATSLPGVGERPSSDAEDEDWQEWIDSAVKSFCRAHQFLEHFKSQVGEGRS